MLLCLAFEGGIPTFITLGQRMIFKAHEPERETPLRFHAGIGDYLIDAEAIPEPYEAELALVA